jgi:restriction endonuclease S subunit
MSKDKEKETIREEQRQQQKRRGLNNRQNGYKLVPYIVPIGIVSEGSEVQLDGSQSYFELSRDSSNGKISSITTTRGIETEDGVSYLWKQVGGSSSGGATVNLHDKNTPKPSFIAHYVDIHNNNNQGSNTTSYPNINTILKFQLILKDKEGIEK